MVDTYAGIEVSSLDTTGIERYRYRIFWYRYRVSGIGIEFQVSVSSPGIERYRDTSRYLSPAILAWFLLKSLVISLKTSITSQPLELHQCLIHRWNRLGDAVAVQ